MTAERMLSPEHASPVYLRPSWVERAALLMLLVVLPAVLTVGLLNRAGIEEFNGGNPIYVEQHRRTQRLVCGLYDRLGEPRPADCPEDGADG